MRAWRIRVSILMVMVLTATVMAPDFGWDMVASQAAHSDHHDGERTSGSTPHERNDCAGHVLGHLAAAGGVCVFRLPAACGESASGSVFRATSSLIHERPEHPPKTARSA